jgi:ankyrin repeat protein
LLFLQPAPGERKLKARVGIMMKGEENHSHTNIDEQVIEALEKPTKKYQICPNRIWAIANSLPEKEAAIPQLFPPVDPRLEDTFAGQKGGEIAEQHKHNFCTASFCEQSQVNFTSVSQRHESPHCKIQKCSVIEDRFQPVRLNEAANSGRPTAWSLDGRRTVISPESYMAISHVWSDGTGTGTWKAGQVHGCLYNFFRSLARLYKCDGIWWDTICMPADKAPRAKALNNMHENYAAASVTLLHDCFLRNLAWTDAETACLAIIVSPWFSRGWTALELARSKKVKVLFKGDIDNSPTIKDLDEDILQVPKPPVDDLRSPRHRIAASMIQYLRDREITSINQLLKVLGLRHTSWARDMAVISGLLVGATVSEDYHNDPFHASPSPGPKDVYQQSIYQRVLKKMGAIGHENLFHGQPTLFNNTSWCPANPLSLPLASTEELSIDEHGNVVGEWKVAKIKSDSGIICLWELVHPLNKVRLQAAMKDDEKHCFLIEPNSEEMVRALLVKNLEAGYDNSTKRVCQFVGSLYFRPEHGPREKDRVSESVVILNSPNENIKAPGKRSKHRRIGLNSDANKNQTAQSGEPNQQSMNLDLYQRRQKSLHEIVNFLLNKHGSKVQNEDLCSAAQNGREREFQKLLDAGANPRYIGDNQSRTVVSYAAEQNHVNIIKCCEKWYEDWCNAVHNFNSKRLWDELRLQDLSDTPKPVVDLLADAMVLLFDYRDAKEFILGGKIQPPISWAVANGHGEALKQLLKWYEVDIETRDSFYFTPLRVAIDKNDVKFIDLLIQNGASAGALVTAAAQQGHTKAVEALLKAGGTEVNIRETDGRTPLSWAAAEGHVDVVKVLIEAKGVNVNIPDNGRSTPLLWAAKNGFTEVVEILLKAYNVDIEFRDNRNRSPLWHAAARGHANAVAELVKAGARIDLGDKNGRTPLSLAAENGYVDTVKVLLDEARSRTKAELTSPRQFKSDMRGMRGGLIDIKDLPCATDGDYDIIEARDEQGRTPLSWAAGEGYTDVVSLLVEETNHREAMALIAEIRSNFNSLEDAERYADRILSVYLPDSGIHRPGQELVNSQDNKGRTPLSWAAEGGHKDAVGYLIKVREQVDCADHLGRTPLWWAVNHGRRDNVELLINEGGVQLDTIILENLRRTAFQEGDVHWDSSIISVLELAVRGSQ